MQRKPRQKIWGFNGIWTHDLRNTGVMLYQLSYEALLEAGQERVQFIPILWREWDDVYLGNPELYDPTDTVGGIIKFRITVYLI